jgi:hypothetical protein
MHFLIVSPQRRVKFLTNRFFVLVLKLILSPAVREDSRDFIDKQFKDKRYMTDNVNHPQHYTSHPSGVECITITRHYCFSIGNAIKYLWRAGLKQDADKTDKEKEIEDLQKAIWYINDRIKQLEKQNDKH